MITVFSCLLDTNSDKHKRCWFCLQRNMNFFVNQPTNMFMFVCVCVLSTPL